MIRSLSALLIVATSATADHHAACPTSSDLEGGVVFQVGDPEVGGFTAVKHLGGSLYWQGQHSTAYPDQWHAFSHLGALQVFLQRQSGEVAYLTVYEHDLSDLRDIQAGLILETVALSGPTEGGQPQAAQLRIEVLQSAPVTIGACDYDVLRLLTDVSLLRPNGDLQPVSQREEFYLPELRYSYVTSAPSAVFIARETDAIVTDADLRQFADARPALKELLAGYGVSPE